MSEKTFEEKFTGLINTLVTDVAVIKEKITNMEKGENNNYNKQQIICNARKDILDDHEKRIRKGEDFRSKTLGGIILLNVILGVAIALIVKYL